MNSFEYSYSCHTSSTKYCFMFQSLTSVNDQINMVKTTDSLNVMKLIL